MKVIASRWRNVSEVGVHKLMQPVFLGRLITSVICGGAFLDPFLSVKQFVRGSFYAWLPDTRFPGTGIIGPYGAGKEKGELKIAHARNFDIHESCKCGCDWWLIGRLFVDCRGDPAFPGSMCHIRWYM